MSEYIQSNQVITLADTNNVISAADTGKTFLVPTNAGAAPTIRTITLPAGQLGLRYRFILNASAGVATNAINITTGAAGGLRGVLLTANSTVPVVAANTNVTFIGAAGAAAAQPGDYIDVCCISATQWSVMGGSQVNGGIGVS